MIEERAKSGPGLEVDVVSADGHRIKRRVPHVHVVGDVGVMHAYHWFQQLPDHDDPAISAYRRVKGFVERALPGGAWSVAQFIRAGLCDIWKCNSTWTGLVSNTTWGSKLRPNIDRAGVDQSEEKAAHSYWSNRVAFSDSSATQYDESFIQTTQRGAWIIQADGTIEFEQVPIGATNAAFLMEIEPSRDGSPRIAVHKFSGGTVVADLTPTRLRDAKDLADMDVQANETWAPSYTFWPLHSEIKMAIRQVNLTKTEERARKLEALERGKAKAVGLETLVPFEAFWRSLSPDERFPLEEFFRLPDSRIGGHGKRRSPPISRAVLIVDRGWCQREVEGARQPSENDQYVGYLVIWPRRCDWSVWASDCLLWMEREGLGVDTPRLLFNFSQSSTASHMPSEVFGLRVPSTLVRLFYPNYRPSPHLFAPAGLVTTSEWTDDEETTPIVTAAWEVSETTENETRTFRLSSAKGYEWQDGWYAKTLNRYKKWCKLKHHNAKQQSQLAQQLRAIDWGLSMYHSHGTFHPQWAPAEFLEDRHEFRHLVIADLNFGFRRYATPGKDEPDDDNWLEVSSEPLPGVRSEQFVAELTSFMKTARQPPVEEAAAVAGAVAGDATKSTNGLESAFADGPKVNQEENVAQVDAVSETPTPPQFEGRLSRRPDWWQPLLSWSAPGVSIDRNQRGWIIVILGRQLPTRDTEEMGGFGDSWINGDLWDVLRHTRVPIKGAVGTVPLFRDKTVVIVSGNLLRATGARISRRLSWERTATDCIRELHRHSRFQPLMEFRHLVVRFGVAGALHVVRIDDPQSGHIQHVSQTLFYDATAKNGYHRDVPRCGHVIGANSVFAARILRELLDNGGSAMAASQEEVCVHSGIRSAIVDCQKVYDEGYGKFFGQEDPYRVEYSVPEQIMLRPVK